MGNSYPEMWSTGIKGSMPKQKKAQRNRQRQSHSSRRCFTGMIGVISGSCRDHTKVISGLYRDNAEENEHYHILNIYWESVM